VGYRVIDANGLALAHVYGQPPDAVAFSDKRLTDDEAEKFARQIVRLPEFIVLERERNKAKSRRRSPPPSRQSLSGILPGTENSLRSSAWPASPHGTSYRATVARIVEAAAGARSRQPSHLQCLWRQE
jgi:hypothetical protein